MSQIKLRRLDPATDQELFQTTWDWFAAAPQWYRDAHTAFNDDKQSDWLYNAGAPGRCDIGVWHDETFIADIILTACSARTVEVHFESAPNADTAALLSAFEMVRDRAWAQGIQRAVTWTPRFNRTILALDKAIGFVDRGVRMFKGITHGKPIEWVELSIANPNSEVSL